MKPYNEKYVSLFFCPLEVIWDLGIYIWYIGSDVVAILKKTLDTNPDILGLPVLLLGTYL